MNDPARRDQVIRYLDLAAYHYLNHPGSVKEVYFVLIMDTEKPPWVLTRYRYNQNLIKGLTSPGLFKPPKRHRLVPWSGPVSLIIFILKFRIDIPNFHGKLNHLWLIYPGQYAYPIDEKISALPLKDIGSLSKQI